MLPVTLRQQYGRVLAAGVWCCASCRPRPGSCISEERPFGFNDWVLATWRAAVWECSVSEGLWDSCISEGPLWSRTSRGLRFGADYRASYGLVRSIGRSTEALGTKVGAVPAEGRGLGVLRIATARSRSLRTMGRAAHCAECPRTLRLQCP